MDTNEQQRIALDIVLRATARLALELNSSKLLRAAVDCDVKMLTKTLFDLKRELGQEMHDALARSEETQEPLEQLASQLMLERFSKVTAAIRGLGRLAPALEDGGLHASLYELLDEERARLEIQKGS